MSRERLGEATTHLNAKIDKDSHGTYTFVVVVVLRRLTICYWLDLVRYSSQSVPPGKSLVQLFWIIGTIHSNMACMASYSYSQLDLGPNEVTYTDMRSAWRRGPQLTITIQGAQVPVHIPVAFVQGSGGNTWGLVLFMVSALVNEQGRLGIQAEGRAFQPVSPEATPTPGEYVFVPAGEQKRSL